MPGYLIPGLRRTARRLVAPRPVMAREEMLDLAGQIIGWTTADTVYVVLEHIARIQTYLTNGQVRTSNDGDLLGIKVWTAFGGKGMLIQTDQIDMDVLRTLVQRCEGMARAQGGSEDVLLKEQDFQDTYLPVKLWHEGTVDAMHDARATLVPALLNPIRAKGLIAAGMVQFVARAKAMVTKDKLQAFYEETDCEVSVTARTKDGTSSGWGGQANREWTQIDAQAVTNRAIDMAVRGVNPKAFEPGRRTVVMTRDAVAQMFRYFAQFYDGYNTEVLQNTPFSQNTPPYSKRTKRVFDERITMSSDPMDPEGGYAPWFGLGSPYANPAMTWADGGILKNLAYGVGMANDHGLPYSDDPFSLRVSGSGELSTIEAMIARCTEGIYVNKLTDVDLLDSKSGLLTGVTRHGCFLIKDGRIDTPVKNFRFIDSPMFMLNKILAVGESHRAAFGPTPPGMHEILSDDWPRRPLIVPPLMVEDFYFTSLSDAV